ncbi:hypothetical protein CNMCM5623_002226 [Aspergillus felis]|uniref:Carrier domain-containing protein n=1 Tax=Aspergillus felis TaxID=1287682 RepID=A0A8H6QBS1_9EURO|nr:hypothetical protein CNMCM5623_002226 [Aspergillus felis]
MGSYSGHHTITLSLDAEIASKWAQSNDSSSIARYFKASWALLLGRLSETETITFVVVEAGHDPVESSCMDSDCTEVSRVESWQVSDSPEVALAEAAKLQKTEFLSDIQGHGARITTGLSIKAHDQPDHPDLLQACDLILALDYGSSSHVSMRYATTSFNDNQAWTRLCSMVQLLEQMIANPALTLRNVSFIGPYSTRLLAKWNPQTLIRPQTCIHTLIQERCHDQPDAEAICAWDGSLRYAQLDILSHNVSRQLQALGVGPESKVPLCFEKSMWTPVAMLGVLRAGGAFVLMDHTHPVSRLTDICSQVQAHVLLTSPSLRELGMRLAPRVLTIPDILGDDPNNALEINDRASPTPANAAYVAFTSGSTGQPKGIVIEHQSFCANSLAQNKIQNLNPETRAFQFASYGFDSSILETLMTLIAGGCVCIPSETQRLNGLAAAINDLRANWVELTPSVARLLRPEQVPNIQSLLLIGEPMSRDQISLWTGKVQLINAYGPAECSVVATVQPCARWDDPSNIGRSHSSHCWIVNPTDHHQLQALGAVGELVISGPIVGRGYLDQPEQTSFVLCPQWAARFGLAPHERFYRTGDLARYNLDDGTLQYIGRKDTQVKIHGQRVDLQEIEHHARQFQKGLAAVAEVIHVDSSSMGKVLALFVTYGAAVGDMLLDQLHDWLSGRLPTFMLPTRYISIDQFPLTKTGKLDRRGLVGLAAQLPAYTPLSDDLQDQKEHGDGESCQGEQTFCALFGEVLGCRESEVDPRDGFYQLGGNSLVAIELVGGAREHKLEITVGDVIRLQTPRRIAQCAGRSREEQAIPPYGLLTDLEYGLSIAAAQCGVKREDIEDIYPCTPLQEGLMYLSIKNPGSFISTYRFAVAQSVNLRRLQVAWERIYVAHPMLRTRIVQLEDGQLFQVVVKSNASPAFDESMTMGLGEPLSRWWFLEDEQGIKPTVFTLTMHHAIFDAWSYRQMLEDLQIVYNHHPAPSRPPFSQVIAYIAKLDMDEARRFWQKEFSGFRASRPFPDTPKRASTVSLRPLSTSQRIPLTQADRDWTLAGKIRLAWALVVASQTNSEDVVFGLTVSGRNAPVPGIDRIAGPTFATFPFRARLDAHASVDDMLLRLRERDIDIMPFEHTGVTRIATFSPEAALACAFQNLLTIRLGSVQGAAAILTDFPENEQQDVRFASYPLSIVVQQQAEFIEAKAVFNAAVFSDIQARSVLEQLAVTLRIVLCEPQIRLQEMMVRHPPDWQQLATWNWKNNPTNLQCMHDVIMRFGLTQPDAEAVCAWDGTLKYQELLTLARSIAGYLQSHGHTPGTVVGICVERSKWFPVAILGVLMAGGAMVLLEPSFPVARLQHICRDADCKMVICSPGLQEKCQSTVGKVVTLTADMITLADYCCWRPPAVTPQDPMYVAFTSGSTGTPKGVVIEHGMVYLVVHGHKDTISASSSSRGLLFASPAFDICVAEVMFMLGVGGCVCVPSEQQRMNDLAGAMQAMRVNLAMLTPSVVRTISPVDVPCLRTLVLGGEAPSAADLATWAPQVRLHQSYGPAECAMYTTTTGPLTATSDPSNIGSCPNASCWIVNAEDHHQLQPVGSVGELLIGGPIVARRYEKRAKETEASFIQSPSWSVHFPFTQGHLFYKTGDLAVLNSDGSLCLLGRKDAQVKLHGQRIELQEIQHCAESYEEGIAAIAELATLQGSTGPKLILFIYDPKKVNRALGVSSSICRETFLPPSDPRRARLHDLKAHLNQHLPAFMVPSLILLVSRLPLNASGKADRRELRQKAEELTRETVEMYMGHPVSQKKPPVTELEHWVRGQFATVLSLDPDAIGIDDDFFALGGDSIAAMRLLTLCRKRNLVLSMLDFLSYGSVELFCVHARNVQHDETPPDGDLLLGSSSLTLETLRSRLDLVDTDRIQDVYPCSEAHSGVLNLYTSNYTGTAIFEIRPHGPSPLHPSQVAAAWERLVRRHAALRTIILHDSSLPGGFLHVVLKNAPANVLVLPHGQDLRHEMQRIVSMPAWDDTAPPYRVVVGQEADGVVLLLLDMGRALVDAMSMSLLLEELSLALRGRRFAHAEEVSYRQYLSYLQGQSSDATARYWKQTLSGIQPCRLPLVAPNPSTPSEPASLRRTLPGTDFASLTSFCRSHHLTVTNVCQLAWALTLRHYTALPDICFGTVLSGRDIPFPAVWQMVGSFFNLLPRRFSLNQDETIVETLRRTQAEMQRQNEHQHCSTPDIVRRAGIPGVNGPRDLFNTVLTVQQEWEAGGANDELDIRLVKLEDATEYDLCMAVSLGREQITVELRYWTATASGAYVACVLECFLRYLRMIVGRAMNPLGSILGENSPTIGKCADRD